MKNTSPFLLLKHLLSSSNSSTQQQTQSHLRHGIRQFLIQVTQQTPRNNNNKASTTHNYQPSTQEKLEIIAHFGVNGGLKEINSILSEARSDVRFETGRCLTNSASFQNGEDFHSASLNSAMNSDNCQRRPKRKNHISAAERGRIKEEFRKFAHHFIRTRQHQDSSSHDQKYLRERARLWNKMIHLNRRQFAYYLRQALHQVSSSDSSPPTLENIKETLQNALQDNQMKSLSRTQRDQLQEELGISREMLNAQLQQLMYPPGKMDQVSKEKLEKWIQEHNNGRLPRSQEEKAMAQTVTGWNQTQLSKYLNRIQSITLTTSEKHLIREKLKQMASSSNEEFLEEVIQDLSRQLNRSVHLIENFVQQEQAREQSVTTIRDRERRLVKQWFEDSLKRGHNGIPSKEEQSQLLSLTNWSRHQLSTFLYYLRTSRTEDTEPGRVNKETKAILRQWIRDNNFEQPKTRDQKQELLKLTGWNIHQLNHQLQVERSAPPGEITKETKSIVTRWLREHGEVRREDKAELMQATGWNRKQLNDQLRRLRNTTA